MVPTVSYVPQFLTPIPIHESNGDATDVVLKVWPPFVHADIPIWFHELSKTSSIIHTSGTSYPWLRSMFTPWLAGTSKVNLSVESRPALFQPFHESVLLVAFT